MRRQHRHNKAEKSSQRQLPLPHGELQRRTHGTSESVCQILSLDMSFTGLSSHTTSSNKHSVNVSVTCAAALHPESQWQQVRLVTPVPYVVTGFITATKDWAGCTIFSLLTNAQSLFTFTSGSLMLMWLWLAYSIATGTAMAFGQWYPKHGAPGPTHTGVHRSKHVALMPLSSLRCC